MRRNGGTGGNRSYKDEGYSELRATSNEALRIIEPEEINGLG